MLPPGGKEIDYHMAKQMTSTVDPMATVAAVMNAAALLQQMTTVRDGQVYVLVPMSVAPETVTALTPEAAATVEEVKGHAVMRATSHDIHRHDFTGKKRGKQTRRFGRARYFSKLHHRQKVENVTINDHHLAPVQAKVMKFVHKAGKDGVTAAQVEEYLGKGDRRKGHGPFSSTKDMLLKSGLLEAREDERESIAV